MKELISKLNEFADELRKKEVSYTKCDKIRLELEDLNKEYHYQFDELMYRKINDICFDYHNVDIERLDYRYILIGRIYLCIDLLKGDCNYFLFN